MDIGRIVFVFRDAVRSIRGSNACTFDGGQEGHPGLAAARTAQRNAGETFCAFLSFAFFGVCRLNCGRPQFYPAIRLGASVGAHAMNYFSDFLYRIS